MFNDANVDNRSRHLVRGRVIVFTTSLFVEFLESSLRYSYPLYHCETNLVNNNLLKAYPAGYGLTFVVEVDGYLTFDPEAQVRICEVGPYREFFYDINSFAVVRPADPFPAVVQSVFAAHYTPQALDGSVLMDGIEVDFTTDPALGQVTNFQYLRLTKPVPDTQFDAVITPYLRTGGLWLGPNHYISKGLIPVSAFEPTTSASL